MTTEERKIKDHAVHLRELLARANTNKAEDIKELIDYIVLYQTSAYVLYLSASSI